MAPRFLIAAAALPAIVACEPAGLTDGGTLTASIGGSTFRLTVSASDATRQRGLGGVTAIPADGGMVFAFTDAAVRGFWMKDCLVDMDIIYLDPLGFVTAIHTMRKEPPRRADESLRAYEARLPRYGSVTPAQFVIELRAGRARELGLQTSQKLQVDLAALRAVAR